MIWLNPAAWIGLLALAGPIAIHILVQRKAERLPFPSLRFLQEGRLASIRRHMLEDVVLLAIRAAIVVAAAAALAGPLVVTPAQRQAWNARIVRAIVVQAADGARRLQPSDRPFLSQTFETPTVADGIPRAVAWLENAPPARRELVIVGPLALGSVTADDLSAVPPGIGIRFERSGLLPTERSVAGGRVLATARELAVELDPSAASGSVRATSRAEGVGRARGSRPIVLQQHVTLKDVATRVQEAGAAASELFPVEVIGSTDARPIVDAAIAATRSQRVWTPAANRLGRLVLIDTAIDSTALADAGPLVGSWTADAVASIARDRDLQTAAVKTAAGLNDPRFSTTPWQPLLFASDGQPLAVASASKTTLVVVSGAKPSSLVTPLLLRAMANALGGPPDLRRAEMLPIPQAQLAAWSRPEWPIGAPRIDRVERDDRRGLWVLVLALLALETWVRRAKTEDRTSAYEEDVRVA